MLVCLHSEIFCLSVTLSRVSLIFIYCLVTLPDLWAQQLSGGRTIYPSYSQKEGGMNTRIDLVCLSRQQVSIMYLWRLQRPFQQLLSRSLMHVQVSTFKQLLAVPEGIIFKFCSDDYIQSNKLTYVQSSFPLHQSTHRMERLVGSCIFQHPIVLWSLSKGTSRNKNRTWLFNRENDWLL